MTRAFSRPLSVFILFGIGFTSNSFALDQIIRPYQSVRSAAMGGVRMTTGLYDENFFNNPARVTANPESKFTVFQITPMEVTSATINTGSKLVSNKDSLNVLAGSAGQNIHNRTQLIFPAFYLASNEDRKFALAFGMIASIQADAMIRQSYQTSFGGVADVGPALTYGRKFLKDDSLSVGLTGRFTYRMGTSPDYSLLDYIRGVPFTVKSLAGDGAMVNFDLGSTYKVTQWGEFDVLVGGGIQNILGGNYKNSTLSLLNLSNSPPPQPRSYGVGVSFDRPDWWKFTHTVFAFEITDVLNNNNGSIFRLLHLGGETHWKSLAFRMGVNQGYLGGGIGLDVHYFTFNIATYGEEMGLNSGSLEDRRYTFDLGIHI